MHSRRARTHADTVWNAKGQPFEKIILKFSVWWNSGGDFDTNSHTCQHRPERVRFERSSWNSVCYELQKATLTQKEARCDCGIQKISPNHVQLLLLHLRISSAGRKQHGTRRSIFKSAIIDVLGWCNSLDRTLDPYDRLHHPFLSTIRTCNPHRTMVLFRGCAISFKRLAAACPGG